MANVLILCDRFAPMVGGSEKMLLDIARGLLQAGHRVNVLTPEGDESVAARFDANEPYHIIRSSTWAKLFRMGASKHKLANRAARLLIVPLVLRQALKFRDADMLIVGHVLPLGTVASLLKRLRPKIKTIVMTYGEDITVYSRGTRMRTMLISALTAADSITCLTQSSAEEIAGLDASLQTRTHVVPPAVSEPPPPTAQQLDTLRQEHGLQGNRILLTLSRLTPRKGIDVTLRAVALLRARYPDLIYLVCGEGSDATRLHQLVGELHIADMVRFAGHASPYVYSFCDVFCMPNRQMPDGEREGFGIVFLEANLAGKPVIGGRSGGAVDAIVHEETGLLVDPQSPDEVAAAISRLLDDRTFADRLGKDGRQRALTKFSTEAFVGRYLDLIQRF